jgi:hypothetical protein
MWENLIMKSYDKQAQVICHVTTCLKLNAQYVRQSIKGIVKNDVWT